MAYLNSTEYTNLSVLPASYIAGVPTDWLTAQLEYWSGMIDARLRKRYACPFATPVSHVVRGWLARLLDPVVHRKVGVDATDAQYSDVAQSAADAMAEIREAADAKDGLYDLPLRSNTADTGITRSPTLAYSELSPYTAGHVQRRDSEGEP